MDNKTKVWMQAKWIASLRYKSVRKSRIYLNVVESGHDVDHVDLRKLSTLETGFLLDALK